MTYRPVVFNSVIDSRYDTKTLFGVIMNFYDPFRDKNLKTKVLDMSNSYYWTESNINMYDVTKTKNIEGYAKDQKYNIIIYEPPRNKKFFEESIYYSNKYKDLLCNNGIIIIRLSDFRQNGQIKGSFDINQIFIQNGFYLYDNLIYQHGNSYSDDDDKIYSHFTKINHSNFMFFKKNLDN